MKEGLPPAANLSERIRGDARLVPQTAGRAVLTDVQYAALESGVADGQSLLVVSPTSTGKTMVGVWAMAAALERRCRAAYLVTHRALANQKFEDLRTLFVDRHLRGLNADIVLATGDEVVDGDGQAPPAPLEASIVVATYEKYLGLLSAAGLPANLSDLVVVCDEIQLISDAARGPAVEILLTLLSRAKCKQMVGLSAVLQERDAENLAGWLGAKLLYEGRREKRLIYECRTPVGTFRADTDSDEIHESREKKTLSTLDIVDELRRDKKRLPIIVFCMTKSQTYELARSFEPRARRTGLLAKLLASLFGGEPETNVENLLARYLPLRFAIHNADMTDEERRVIEAGLADGEIDVVFATSTLAAGVNFPLASAVFHTWTRWDSASRMQRPIEPSEFHNMAGRVGRMGFNDGDGLVIFCAERNRDIEAAQHLLDFTQLSELTPRIIPEQFEALALHLISAGLGLTEKDLFEIVRGTLSAQRELDTNRAGLEVWEAELRAAVRELSVAGFVQSE